jgi:NTP pyrophosphohydrolases containing a Zn-finger, probably nucleic-acid-binding
MIRLRQPHNFYAGNAFNRLAERRQDAAWLNALLASSEASLLPMWRDRHLITGSINAPNLGWLSPQTLPVTTEEVVLLGEFRGRYYFGVQLAADREPALHAHGEFHDLRAVGGQMDRDEAGLLGYARALLLWRDKHRFCGRCGSPTQSIDAGHVLRCSNAHCNLMQFPRLDPAIIVLVTDGERVLLGRQAAWPAGRYSTLAGYVEWAESIEEAVVREVHEESGVVVDAVEYHSSQPWPFPSSLMLGFIAHAASTDIQLNDHELEEARWFTREQLARGDLLLSSIQSISFRLIEHWYDQDAPRPLREEVMRTQR